MRVLSKQLRNQPQKIFVFEYNVGKQRRQTFILFNITMMIVVSGLRKEKFSAKNFQ